jgi:hypothetical protein
MRFSGAFCLATILLPNGKQKVESWIDPEAASATGTYNIAGQHFGVTQCWKTDKDKNPQTRTSDVKDRETERRNGRI